MKQASALMTRIDHLGGLLLRWAQTGHRLLAFALITLGVAWTRKNASSRVIRPILVAQIYRAGFRLLPLTTLFSLALGLVIIGQTVSLLNRVGASREYVGVIMVTVVVRELGPLLTALFMLMRVGTSTVIELGTARAFGEVEGLEALAIDPIHYLVLPRLWGWIIAIFAVTVYLIIGTILSGYFFIFLQDIPLLPREYFGQIAEALSWMDFLLLGLKACSFGAVCGIITCYHGLARPLRIEEVSQATVKALAQGAIACILLDALFLVIYLIG